jgi:hypothetical protein
VLTPGQLAQCRATHETIFGDRLRIRHDDPVEGVFDPVLGYAPVTMPAPFYDGPGRIQARPVQSGAQTSAEQVITVLGYAVAVPWSVSAVRPTDIVECYQSADPRNVGKTLRVEDVQSSTFETARRMSCTDYQPREA